MLLWVDEYFGLLYSVKKIRPSLTTSKEGLKRYNIFQETTRFGLEPSNLTLTI